MKLLLMRVLRPIVGRIPRFFYWLALPVGWIAYHTRREARRNAIRNMLPLCDGDLKRAKKEAVRAFQQVAKYYVDLATLPRRDMARFEADKLNLIHAERLSVLEHPGPVVMVSGHMGNAELAIQALTHRGRPFVALVEALRPQSLTDYLVALRSSAGGTFHEADFAGLRACLAALKQGQLVGLMGDRDIQGTGVCMTLAGRCVKLPRGPWELARRSRAPVLPVFCTRIGKDNFDVYIEEPFFVAHSEDAEADVRQAAGRFAQLLDLHLRRQPGQWAVLEDFWKVHACDSEKPEVATDG